MSLFTAGTLRATLENHRERMIATIDAHNANSLLNTPEDTITDYFVSEYQVDPLVIAAREEVTDEVERWVDEEVSRLRQHVGFQAGEVLQHNTQLRPTASQRIRDRRFHLLASQNL